MRTIFGLVFAFAMTIPMNQRSARLPGERQRLSGEMASAAEVQSLLMTSLPTAGELYRIAVYVPASEVGGDFYQVLVGHKGGGFVTCCCARFDANGAVTIANAGHPSPYCDGL